jgi:hypothetical protein
MTHAPPRLAVDGDAVAWQAAAVLADRLTESAVWDGDGCTWLVERPRRDRPAFQLSGDLYRGTAGIALALGEYGVVAGDRAAVRTATGALRHALAEAASLPVTYWGVWTGRLGVAWVAARLADRIGVSEFRKAARRLLEDMRGHEAEDVRFDAMSGGAGAIVPLLWLARDVDAPFAVESAEALGRRLMAAALPQPHGVAWPVTGGASAPLTGLAHGTAGVAVGLLELAAQTGDAAFYATALAGFAYERWRFDAAEENWPDFRVPPVEMRPPTFDPRRPPYMRAWCHGAAGIGLTRLRAWCLTGAPGFREDAEAAIRTTRQDFHPEASRAGGPTTYCYCHGFFGNAELLLRAADDLAQPVLADEVRAFTDRALRRAEAAAWAWTGGGKVYEPGLMLGDAGVLHFLTRRVAPTCLPSPLSLVPPTGDARASTQAMANLSASPNGCADREPTPAILAARAVDAFFGRTHAAFRRLGVVVAPHLGATDTPVAAFRRARAIADTPGARHALLRDAFALDRSRFELLLAPPVANSDDSESLTLDSVVVLSANARVVETMYDWARWGGAPDAPAFPPVALHATLQLRQANGVREFPLGAVARTLVEGLSTPSPVHALLRDSAGRLARSLAFPGDERDLDAPLTSQLQQLREAGAIDIVRAQETAQDG